LIQLTRAWHASACQPLHHIWAAHVDDFNGRKKKFYHVIWFVLAFSIYLDITCIVILSGLMPHWFSFFPLNSRSSTSIYTLPMEKITTTLQFLFCLDLAHFLWVAIVLFEKFTSNWSIFSILSSFSFSSFKFDPQLFWFNFCFEMAYKFYLFIAISSSLFFHVWSSFLLLLYFFSSNSII